MVLGAPISYWAKSSVGGVLGEVREIGMVSKVVLKPILLSRSVKKLMALLISLLYCESVETDLMAIKSERICKVC